MKSTSKTFGFLLGAALLFASCNSETNNPPVEFASAPFYDFAQLPGASHAANSRGTISGFLSDCENQLGRLKDGLSASFGTPHRAAFPH